MHKLLLGIAMFANTRTKEHEMENTTIKEKNAMKRSAIVKTALTWHQPDTIPSEEVA